MTDIVQIEYFIIALFADFNILFAVAWWIYERGCSLIFKLVLLLWIGISVQFHINFVARSWSLCGDFSYLHKWWWGMRVWIMLFVVVAFTGVALWRFFFGKKRPTCRAKNP